MDKINFINGNQPAVNDTNLNQLQANIENAINGTVLYESENGTVGEITLLEDASNFKFLEIYFQNIDGIVSSQKTVYTTKNIILDITVVGSSQIFVSNAGIAIDGNKITWKWNRRGNSWNSYTDDGQAIRILKVIGYKG